MPSPQAILAGLKLATNDAIAVAVLWHVSPWWASARYCGDGGHRSESQGTC